MKKILILSALVIGMLSSCSEGDRLPTDDLTGPKIVGFQSDVKNVTYFEDVGAVNVDLPVVIVGMGNGQLSSDVVVTYQIDTANTTAVEGQEFSFVDSNHTVTIPAGSDFGIIPITVNTGSLNPTSATKLVLTLVSSDPGIVVEGQSAVATVNFVGCVSQIQEGSYTVTRGPGSTIGNGTTYQDVITMVGTNKFTTAHTPPYIGTNESPAGLPSYGFTFEDVCGEITVADQNLFNYYTNIVSGAPFTNDVLNNQQGMVVDANTFVIYLKVAGSNTYFTYATYTKNL
jgi:hypothetical protein